MLGGTLGFVGLGVFGPETLDFFGEIGGLDFTHEVHDGLLSVVGENSPGVSVGDRFWF